MALKVCLIFKTQKQISTWFVLFIISEFLKGREGAASCADKEGVKQRQHKAA